MFRLWRQMWLQPVENIDIDLHPEQIWYYQTHFIIYLVNNRVIVIENRQKIFQLQLQLQLPTFGNVQLQLQLQQNRVINYNFVTYDYNFSKPD